MNRHKTILKAFALSIIAPLLCSTVFAEEVDLTEVLSNKITSETLNPNPQQAVMANGDIINFQVFGDNGPFLFMGPHMYLTPLMPNMLPTIQAYVDGLKDRYRVIIADYPRGTGNSAAADASASTAEGMVDDLLRIATAAGADKFAWWGYSFGGALGLQLASRTDRISALVIGGYPPQWQPISDMLNALKRTEMQLKETQDNGTNLMLEAYAQSIAFYSSISTINQTELLQKITAPRMVYHDVDDTITMGGLTHDLSARTRAAAEELETMGWEVHWMNTGKAHMGMSDVQKNLDVFMPFLDKTLLKK